MRSHKCNVRSVLVMGGLAMAMVASPATAQTGNEQADEKMDLLILGGTVFLGPALVEAAQARGHTVTLFNRGRSNPGIFPDLEKLVGDRDPEEGEGLKALEGRTWDAVIDTSGYAPANVKASADLLQDSVDRYVFISTISVYATHDVPYADESAPVGKLTDEEGNELDGMEMKRRDVNGETYGPLKALCEQTVRDAFGDRATVIRPGLIVGPRDRTDRFNYWPIRVRQGGEILAPGDGSDPIQIIDVRDLAEFTIQCVEDGTPGTFNAVTPAGRFSMAEILHGCKAVVSNDAQFVWVDADFLEEQEVSAWGNMPAWVPAGSEYAGFGLVSSEAAVHAGLTFRPLAVTVKDTIDWFETLPAERQALLGPGAVDFTPENASDTSVVKRRAGMNGEREKEVIAAWREQLEAEAEEEVVEATAHTEDD